MSKVVSLFNHKGGVSKTTTTFHLGWALAETGKRVLIVDGDPQCNLTGMVLGFDGDDDFDDFYTNPSNADLNSCLAPTFSGSQTPLVPATITTTKQPNLFLLAGHLDLSRSETQLTVALSTRYSIPAIQNLPGSINHLIRLTAEANDIDIVLIDMSPSVGGLNTCLLMGSDYFIVPTSPDYYCKQAINSVSKVVPDWNKEVDPFRDSSLTYCLPIQPPKFLGIISQRYRPRDGHPAAAFQKWIDRIGHTVDSCLIPRLEPIGMTVSLSEFQSAVPSQKAYNLANIADFNTLIVHSQENSTPVFALSDVELNKHGIVKEVMQKNMGGFKRNFDELAQAITLLTHI